MSVMGTDAESVIVHEGRTRSNAGAGHSAKLQRRGAIVAGEDAVRVEKGEHGIEIIPPHSWSTVHVGRVHTAGAGEIQF